MAAKRVLLVDDDVDLLKIGRLVLEKAGFEVVTAENGDEGFAVASAAPVDVAVLDVMMDTPTEGFDLARKLRQHDATKHIPLVMLSSVNTENEAMGSYVRFNDGARDPLWLPVDRFLDKPVSAQDLVSVIRTLTGEWSFSRK